MNSSLGLPMTPGDERLAKIDPHAMDVMKRPEGQRMVGDIRSSVRESMVVDYTSRLRSLLGKEMGVSGQSDRGDVSIVKLADGSIAVISNSGVAVEEFVVTNGEPFGIRYSPKQGADGEGTVISAEGLGSILNSFQPVQPVKN